MELLKSIKTKFGRKANDQKKATDALETPLLQNDSKQIQKTAKTDPKTSSKQSAQAGALFSSILKKARVTEKTAHLTAHNQYVFDVASFANKTQISSAVFAIYNIKPTSVNIIRTKGKNVHFGKMRGKRSDNKKALVTIPAGKKLDIYENV